MRLGLSIGGATLALEAEDEVLEAVCARYGAFVSPASSEGRAWRLRVTSAQGGFEPAFESVAPAEVRASAPGRVLIEGAVQGGLDLQARLGWVDEARGLGAVDALVRLVLSVAIPLDAGGLLLHAASIAAGTGESEPGGARAGAFGRGATGAGEGASAADPATGRPRGEAVALCGRSGAGKSTAARAFGAASDELSVVRSIGARWVVEGTPYWQGRPTVAGCRALVCLTRGGTPGVAPLTGGEALRQLIPHVVRYAALPEVERAVFGAVARVIAGCAVVGVSCPDGAGYLPFLAQALAPRELG